MARYANDVDPIESRAPARDQLERDTKAFLARGGSIDIVAAGVSGDQTVFGGQNNALMQERYKRSQAATAYTNRTKIKKPRSNAKK